MSGSNIAAFQGMNIALVALCVLSCAGCAYKDERVRLVYHPDTQITNRYNEARPITISVSDQRAAKDRIGIKGATMAQGLPLGIIDSEEKIEDFIASALTDELAARAIRRISTADVVVHIDITYLANEFKLGVLSGESDAHFSYVVKVTAGHTVVYSRALSGTGGQGSIQFCTGENAKAAVELAVKNGIEQLMNDPQFFSVLQK